MVEIWSFLLISKVTSEKPTTCPYLSNFDLNKKKSNETQAPHIFFFTLLFMLGNYEPTCIVTLKMVIIVKFVIVELS